ncbi:ABC transporter substrate-binding protein [Mycetocola reblochoni]|uniref:Alpha-glucosides-binding periplasmic protein AglE n=2 Tax=Mycetocola reblochoni TaxID=331618 RepID=A0A1R4JXR5_9MICO|nr:ABC transporter substrate-binding protein [Mycetocola reblochoni]RLP70593.1 carbohydrate ABC transporter substrate-binding protein [Mycetocola reblochoni]SJN36768.1 Alpha-glucosides-binding periplasmic protein AglE precursor [Mycetocola reblochoni REB411]
MSITRRHRVYTTVATLGVAGLTLTACSSGPGVQQESGDSNTVTIYGTIVDAEAELLEQSWADWAEENDITIKYEGSKEFETQISVRAQGGNAPDIAIFPQPGLLADIAGRDYLTPAPAAVEANVDQYWSADWKAYGTVDDTFYAAPLMANLKGYIWYSPSQFEENGWEVPTTWDELLTLTADIRDATDAAPWCAGFGSDAATGWPGTDWVEDLVLRQQGPDVYDQWVANEVPFTDDRIKEAFDSVGEILLNPDYVNAGFGDVRSINSTAFGDVAPKLVDGTCALHHQASFYDGFITEAGGTVGEDGDVWAFMTPAAEAGSQAVTGGGELVGAFNEDEATQKVLEYLSSPEWANSRVSLGGVISANTGLDPANASSPILQDSIRILQDDATTFRFDASDLMPSAVGAGTFWKGIIDWVNGTDVDTVTQQIEGGWPSK